MSDILKIAFLDLVSLHEELEAELLPVFQKTLRTAGFVGGPMVDEFEREFAKFCDAKYCVGLASGTDAVRFALMAAGVRTGEVVLTVPNTFIATTEGISQAGGRPDFVDVDERTYCMDPASFRNTSSENASWTARPENRITANSGLRSQRLFRCICTDKPQIWIQSLKSRVGIT